MIYQDSRTGHLDDCDAGGPCDECGADMPLRLVGDDLLCRLCLLGRLCPSFATARVDNGTRGFVAAGAARIWTNAWAGEIRT